MLQAEGTVLTMVLRRKEETHENQRRLSCEIGRKEKISEDEASVWTP